MLQMFTGETHLDHISFVLLQHLDGLGRLWIDDENTGVTSLSYQPLPTPTLKRENDRKGRVRHEKKCEWQGNRKFFVLQNKREFEQSDAQTHIKQSLRCEFKDPFSVTLICITSPMNIELHKSCFGHYNFLFYIHLPVCMQCLHAYVVGPHPDSTKVNTHIKLWTS